MEKKNREEKRRIHNIWRSMQNRGLRYLKKDIARSRLRSYPGVTLSPRCLLFQIEGRRVETRECGALAPLPLPP